MLMVSAAQQQLLINHLIIKLGCKMGCCVENVENH